MTSVHGITVAGGTFPAEIWNAFYVNAGHPLRGLRGARGADRLVPFFGSYTVLGASDYYDYDYDDDSSDERRRRHDDEDAERRGVATARATTPTSTRPAPARTRPRRRPAPAARPAPRRARAAGGGGGGGRRRPADRRHRGRSAELDAAGLGFLGLAGLAIAAVPLAAPGAGAGPGRGRRRARTGSLGLYGDGLGIGGGAYYGFLWLAFVSYLAVLAAAPALDSRLLWAAIVARWSPPSRWRRRCSPRTSSATSPTPGSAPSTASTPTPTPPPTVPGDAAFLYVGWRDDVERLRPAVHPAHLSAGVALGAAGAVGAEGRGRGARCWRWRCSARASPRPAGIDPRVGRRASSRSTRWSSSTSSAAPTTTALMMLLLIGGCAGGAGRARGRGRGRAASPPRRSRSRRPSRRRSRCSAPQRRRRLLAGALGGAGRDSRSRACSPSAPHALDAVGLAGENQAADQPLQRARDRSRGSSASTSSRSGSPPWSLYAVLVAWLLAWIVARRRLAAGRRLGGLRPAGRQRLAAALVPDLGAAAGGARRATARLACGGAGADRVPAGQPGSAVAGPRGLSAASGAASGSLQPWRRPSAVTAPRRGPRPGQHGPDDDRDQRADREAAARQRRLDRPGEGGVAHPEAGRSDEREQRGDVADRLRRADDRQVARAGSKRTERATR